MSGLPQASTNNQTAQLRAASNLQQRYGAQAANQVAQLREQSQAALAIPGPQRPQGLPLPGMSPDQKPPQGYSPMPQPQRAAVTNAQTDGAGDSLATWKAEVARRRAEAEKHRGEGDHMLREQLQQMELRREGGGLMVPLDERYGKGVKRKMGTIPTSIALTTSAASAQFDGPSDVQPPSTYQTLVRAQMDGGAHDDEDEDKKEEIDEDAINSDLDDPDELDAAEQEGDDSSAGQVMLCTYDKVQRVKNKWKCTLKDGILTSGGKE